MKSLSKLISSEALCSEKSEKCLNKHSFRGSLFKVIISSFPHLSVLKVGKMSGQNPGKIILFITN